MGILGAVVFFSLTLLHFLDYRFCFLRLLDYRIHFLDYRFRFVCLLDYRFLVNT